MSDKTAVQERIIPRSEVGVEQLALASWNAFTVHDTSSRSVMMTGHLPSSLTISNPSPPTCSTLVNYEYKKYTFNSKFKSDGELVKVVPLYRRTGDRNSIHENPLETYIYYNTETNELSCLEHQNYFRLGTSSFGYRYNINTEAEKEIFDSRQIKKGTILGDSPNIDDDGEYCPGLQANVMMATLPGVVEDGEIISQSFANKTKFKMLTTYVINCGSDYYPVNLYGNPDNDEYKIHPDIGEFVRDDGLLIALRRRDPVSDITNQNKYKLTEYDPFFDRCTFDYKGAKVIDVRVHSDFVTDQTTGALVTHRKMSTPEMMAQQPLKYIRARKRYLRDIYETYLAERKRNPNLRLSDEMNTLVFEAIQEESNWLVTRKGANGAREKLTKAYHKAPLDDYRIEITVEREITPTVGNKYTGWDGDKGIAVIVWPDEDMPVDGLGNRADVIVDPTAVTKRTIAGRTLHSFIAGGMRDIRVREGLALGLPLGTSPEVCMQWVENNPAAVKDLFDRIMYVRKEITPDAYRAVLEEGYAKEVLQREMERTKKQRSNKISFLNTPQPQPRIYSVMEVEVLDFLVNGMNIETPPDNEVPLYTVAKIIKEKFTPQYGPVTYRVNGRQFTSERPIMIGSLYQILLDKTGLENAAVASGKTQHFGIPAKLTHAERRAMPVRQQPTRAQGESEVHNEIAAAGSKFTYELLEASNSPHAHRNICQAIFDAPEPTRLTKVVGAKSASDPISRPLEVALHILECGGHTLIRDDN